MPTYEYQCGACEHRFEEFQSITAAPLKKCPACGKRALQRLIGTGGGIIFKGSGFYQTDYRTDSYKKAAEADKPATTAASTSSSGSGKTDAAPAKTDAGQSAPAEPAKKGAARKGGRAAAAAN